jgi:SAM-dependent methyltransferase
MPRPPSPTFADIYDAVVGRDFWGHWWHAFEQVVADHGVAFASVCDVACGTGEMARRFARRGLTVYGVDNDPDMLRVARDKCIGTDVRFLLQPMQELALPEPVDLVVCCYDALNHLEGLRDLEATFRGFAAALTPGGHAVCDLATVHHLARDWGTGTFRAVTGGMESLWQTVWEPEARRAAIHLTVMVPRRDGKPVRVTRHVVEYGYPKAHIEAAMGRAGLTVVEVRDMIPWTPGSEASERLFYLLRRGPA